MRKPIQTKSDLDEACSLSQALIFLWVEWAIQARQSALSVDRLLISWNATYPESSLPMYTADLSDQSGEVWGAVRLWLARQKQPTDGLTCAGGGALAWCVNGVVVDFRVHTAAIVDEELLAITQMHFASRK